MSDLVHLSPTTTYNPETGRFYRNGKPADLNHPRGYLYVCILGRTVLSHRAAWECMRGAIPKGMCIDHINRDKTDNRIVNLRVVTFSENAANARLSIRNKSGYRGVAPQAGKWLAYITVDGKCRKLGYHNTPEDAYAAHLRAAKEAWGDKYKEARKR
jgi:hypothetical protein